MAPLPSVFYKLKKGFSQLKKGLPKFGKKAQTIIHQKNKATNKTAEPPKIDRTNKPTGFHNNNSTKTITYNSEVHPENIASIEKNTNGPEIIHYKNRTDGLLTKTINPKNNNVTFEYDPKHPNNQNHIKEIIGYEDGTRHTTYENHPNSLIKRTDNIRDYSIPPKYEYDMTHANNKGVEKIEHKKSNLETSYKDNRPDGLLKKIYNPETSTTTYEYNATNSNNHLTQRTVSKPGDIVDFFKDHPDGITRIDCTNSLNGNGSKKIDIYYEGNRFSKGTMIISESYTLNIKGELTTRTVTHADGTREVANTPANGTISHVTNTPGEKFYKLYGTLNPNSVH